MGVTLDESNTVPSTRRPSYLPTRQSSHVTIDHRMAPQLLPQASYTIEQDHPRCCVPHGSAKSLPTADLRGRGSSLDCQDVSLLGKRLAVTRGVNSNLNALMNERIRHRQRCLC